MIETRLAVAIIGVAYLVTWGVMTQITLNVIRDPRSLSGEAVRNSHIPNDTFWAAFYASMWPWHAVRHTPSVVRGVLLKIVNTLLFPWRLLVGLHRVYVGYYIVKGMELQRTIDANFGGKRDEHL